MTSLVVPDVLIDVRYWLRHHPLLSPITSGRVFFRIPERPSGWPVQRVYRTAGGITGSGGDAPTQVVNVSIECVHNTDSGYTTLRQLVQATETALFTLPAGTLLNPTGATVALDALVTNVIDNPDPETGWPRLIADSRFFIQPI